MQYCLKNKISNEKHFTRQKLRKVRTEKKVLLYVSELPAWSGAWQAPGGLPGQATCPG